MVDMKVGECHSSDAGEDEQVCVYKDDNGGDKDPRRGLHGVWRSQWADRTRGGSSETLAMFMVTGRVSEEDTEKTK